MPLFDYQCRKCDLVTEAFFKMDAKPRSIPCSCGGEATQLFTIGGVQGDELPSWAQHEHARGCYQSVGDKPIETRSEYKKHLESRGIIETSAKREI